MKRVYFLFIATFFLVITSIASKADEVPTHAFLYDPLIWKDKLNLTQSQCGDILEVNNRFYEQIVKSRREVKSEQKSEKLEEYVRERNEEIDRILSSRQKIKWGRISKKYSYQ